MKLLSNVIAFPTDAESSPFFGALASALTPALGYTEDTPFFCGQKASYCVGCGNCKSTTLQKHRLLLYHDYQSFTGVSLGFVWPEEDSAYQTLPGWHKGWRWPDEFFRFIFGYAGLAYKRFPKGSAKDDVLAAVRASIDRGLPLLMKLGAGPDWHVVTGYDGDGTLCGLDAHKHFDHTMRPTREIVAAQSYTDDGLFILADWYTHFRDAVVITGSAEKTVRYGDVLARMIQTLEHPAHGRLERDTAARLDGVSAANAWDTARWLLGVVGFPIEARWHVADSSLHTLCENQAAKDKLFGVIRQYVFDAELNATHGVCWKIWKQLGVGPETGYDLPAGAGDLLQRPQTRAELKRLFSIVFANDRVVLGLLREAADIIKKDEVRKNHA